jgi:hypothetical protein
MCGDLLRGGYGLRNHMRFDNGRGGLWIGSVVREVMEGGTMRRVLTTQIGFVTIAEAIPAVIAEAMWIRYSGRPYISLWIWTMNEGWRGLSDMHV